MKPIILSPKVYEDAIAAGIDMTPYAKQENVPVCGTWGTGKVGVEQFKQRWPIDIEHSKS